MSQRSQRLQRSPSDEEFENESFGEFAEFADSASASLQSTTPSTYASSSSFIPGRRELPAAERIKEERRQEQRLQQEKKKYMELMAKEREQEKEDVKEWSVSDIESIQSAYSRPTAAEARQFNQERRARERERKLYEQREQARKNKIRKAVGSEEEMAARNSYSDISAQAMKMEINDLMDRQQRTLRSHERDRPPLPPPKQRPTTADEQRRKESFRAELRKIEEENMREEILPEEEQRIPKRKIEIVRQPMELEERRRAMHQLEMDRPSANWRHDPHAANTLEREWATIHQTNRTTQEQEEYLEALKDARLEMERGDVTAGQTLSRKEQTGRQVRAEWRRLPAPAEPFRIDDHHGNAMQMQVDQVPVRVKPIKKLETKKRENEEFDKREEIMVDQQPVSIKKIPMPRHYQPEQREEFDEEQQPEMNTTPVVKRVNVARVGGEGKHENREPYNEMIQPEIEISRPVVKVIKVARRNARNDPNQHEFDPTLPPELDVHRPVIKTIKNPRKQERIPDRIFDDYQQPELEQTRPVVKQIKIIRQYSADQNQNEREEFREESQADFIPVAVKLAAAKQRYAKPIVTDDENENENENGRMEYGKYAIDYHATNPTVKRKTNSNLQVKDSPDITYGFSNNPANIVTEEHSTILLAPTAPTISQKPKLMVKGVKEEKEERKREEYEKEKEDNKYNTQEKVVVYMPSAPVLQSSASFPNQSKIKSLRAEQERDQQQWEAMYHRHQEMIRHDPGPRRPVQLPTKPAMNVAKQEMYEEKRQPVQFREEAKRVKARVMLTNLPAPINNESETRWYSAQSENNNVLSWEQADIQPVEQPLAKKMAKKLKLHPNQPAIHADMTVEEELRASRYQSPFRVLPSY